MPATEDRPALDSVEIHQVLSNRRRQYALQFLWNAGGRLPVRELSERVAAAETGESPPPTNIRQSVYTSLHQTHLPKLVELGVVEYETMENDVELTDLADRFRPYLDVPQEHRISWVDLYIAVPLLGLVGSLGAMFGVPLIADLGSRVSGTILFGVIFFAAIYQRFRHTDRGS